MRQIEKTITANSTFEENVAELKAAVKAKLSGMIASQYSFNFATV